LNWIPVIVVLFVVYGLFSRRLSHSPITGPMIFTGAGIAVGLILEREGITQQVISLELQGSMVQTLLEATLIIILFSDAVVIDIAAVRREAFLPSRLLGIGLPLTIAVGTAVAMLLFPELGFWPAAVVGVILAPTDAALGQAVIANDGVPDLVRQGLGVESGLNDGIVVPFLAIAIAGATNEMQSGAEIAKVFVEEIGFAVVVGILVGWAGGKALKFAYSRGWMSREWRQVTVVSFAVLCFVLADPIGGSGFIAAFVGGLVFGRLVRRDYPDICNFSEGIAHLLTMVAFFTFGVLILVPVRGVITWKVVLYAIISLTFVRMIPVALALLGTNLGSRTKLYIGWFGPRGLASLVFMGTVVVESEPAFSGVIVAVGATTVALSVLMHGLTAWPGSVRYAAWYKRTVAAADTEEMPESMEVTHMPRANMGTRIRRPPGSDGSTADD
jgi:NhaP-type Na+/H+ or K+/H+ antiporter